MWRTSLQLAAAVSAMAILAVPAAASAAPGPGAPRTPVPGVSSLNSVACPTAGACVSVGSDNSLNGKSAIITAATGAVKAWSGDLANLALYGVACPGTASCLAVGSGAVASVAVASGAMKVTATPKPPVNGTVGVGTIACAGTTKCYATGFEGSGIASTAVVLSLSPAGKLLATTENSGTGIGSIACPSARLCLMGEAYTSGTVIQLLNNGKFGTSRPLPAGTYIQAISCYEASLCYALAGNGSSKPDELFPLNPKTGTAGSMAAISGFSGTTITCISASKCLVTGLIGTGPTAKAGVLAVVDGEPRTPVKYAGSGASFQSIACASTSTCYAAGSTSAGAIVDKVKS